jgi:Zn ribbon nucleic-acid-binding protein
LNGHLSEHAESTVLKRGRLPEVYVALRRSGQSVEDLTWWVHPKDPSWYNEISLWTSFEALKDWHMNTYHKQAKAWAVRSGAIMEDIITNFELKSTRLIRVCPCCALISDKAYDLHQEQQVLAEACAKCGFQFPVMPETPDSTAVFKDVLTSAASVDGPG